MEFYYHISEEPNIEKFVPRKTVGNPTAPEIVWALDEKSVVHYYLPRDCPRVIYWLKNDTSVDDQMKYFPSSEVSVSHKVMLLEQRWRNVIQHTTVYQYQFPASVFTCVDENAGYYGSTETVVPLKVEPATDLLCLLKMADIEIRFVLDLTNIVDEIRLTSLGFSMIRIRNAGKEYFEQRKGPENMFNWE